MTTPSTPFPLDDFRKAVNEKGRIEWAKYSAVFRSWHNFVKSLQDANDPIALGKGIVLAGEEADETEMKLNEVLRQKLACYEWRVKTMKTIDSINCITKPLEDLLNDCIDIAIDHVTSLKEMGNLIRATLECSTFVSKEAERRLMDDLQKEGVFETDIDKMTNEWKEKHQSQPFRVTFSFPDHVRKQIKSKAVARMPVFEVIGKLVLIICEKFVGSRFHSFDMGRDGFGKDIIRLLDPVGTIQNDWHVEDWTVRFQLSFMKDGTLDAPIPELGLNPTAKKWVHLSTFCRELLWQVRDVLLQSVRPDVYVTYGTYNVAQSSSSDEQTTDHATRKGLDVALYETFQSLTDEEKMKAWKAQMKNADSLNPAFRYPRSDERLREFLPAFCLTTDKDGKGSLNKLREEWFRCFAITRYNAWMRLSLQHFFWKANVFEVLLDDNLMRYVLDLDALPSTPHAGWTAHQRQSEHPDRHWTYVGSNLSVLDRAVKVKYFRFYFQPDDALYLNDFLAALHKVIPQEEQKDVLTLLKAKAQDPKVALRRFFEAAFDSAETGKLAKRKRDSCTMTDAEQTAN